MNNNMQTDKQNGVDQEYPDFTKATVTTQPEVRLTDGDGDGAEVEACASPATEEKSSRNMTKEVMNDLRLGARLLASGACAAALKQSSTPARKPEEAPGTDANTGLPQPG